MDGLGAVVVRGSECVIVKFCEDIQGNTLIGVL